MYSSTYIKCMDKDKIELKIKSLNLAHISEMLPAVHYIGRPFHISFKIPKALGKNITQRHSQINLMLWPIL